SSNFNRWYNDGQKKVVVKGSNESTLRQLQQHARDIGLTNSLVSDAGLTEVPPGTVTCLGVGPANESKIDEITGNLSLF
ncbi:MAG: aminoacyl-tRNA hydrolase, partial [Candidatus Thermoplasmatota archaeon]|nr:aminoacyl-tRNA hydrolase [Candidatus Thermoplasmatota archaeon]